MSISTEKATLQVTFQKEKLDNKLFKNRILTLIDILFLTNIIYLVLKTIIFKLILIYFLLYSLIQNTRNI